MNHDTRSSTRSASAVGRSPLLRVFERWNAKGAREVDGTPVFKTSRLIVRGWRDDDVESWVQMNADPKVMKFLLRRYTRELSESIVRAIRETLERVGYGWWVVEVRGGLSFAGVICLQDVPFSAPFTPAREIGWRFAFEAWGRGYATEAASAALGFAFDQLNWNEVVAFTSVANVRSQRVMQRLGMRHDPRDDFDHPRLEEGHPLRRHLLYRIQKP